MKVVRRIWQKKFKKEEKERQKSKKLKILKRNGEMKEKDKTYVRRRRKAGRKERNKEKGTMA